MTPQFRKRLLASSVLFGAVLAAAPAFAQSQQPVTQSPDSAAAAAAAQAQQSNQPDNGQASPANRAPAAPVEQPNQVAPTPSATAVSGVTVTGSRIRRTEFTSDSPIQVVTAEESTLEGLSDTAQILQHASTANNATQINNFFTGFLVNGGAGVNTLDLRGLGAARTLVILNGRRMGPAGVGGTVGSVDLNTIPSAAIDHIEILKSGASSVYGSDAVAGVVNIITKKNLDGGDMHLFVKPAERQGGEEAQVDAAWGKTFSRGYFTISGSAYRQNSLRTGDRSYLKCAQDIARDPTTGQRLDIIDPATGQPKCQNSAFLGEVVDVSFTGLAFAPDPNAHIGPGGFAVDQGPGGVNLNGWRSVGNVYRQDGTVDTPLFGDLFGTGSPVDIPTSRASLAEFGTDDPRLATQTAMSPVTRYSVMASGAFDLASHHQLYGEFLFNERQSKQLAWGQFFPTVSSRNIFNPFYSRSANYNGFVDPAFGTGATRAVAFPISLRSLDSKQKVDYGRLVLGVRGDIPDIGFLKSWSYDLFGQYSRSYGVYGQQFTYQDRVNATAGSTNAAGCDPNAISVSGSKSLAQVEGPNAVCMPINYFTPAHLQGAWTPEERAYLFGYETGHTTYDHAYIEGSATGDLFTLPAGPVGAAVGFQLRHERIDDVPGPNAQARNYWGYSTAGITKGSDNVSEAFAEVRVPLLANLPLVDRLDLDVSGRYSDYNLFGSAGTYKVGLDWKVNSWLRFRGTQGTSFRAPTLYERFLNPTLGFAGQLSIDPCINYGRGGVSQIIQTNCAAAGIPPNYGGGGSSASVFGGGGANLKPETSLAQTVGFVVTPRWFNLDLNVAVDYFNYKVDNQIQQFGASNIVLQCMRSTNYPNDPFCSLFTRDPTTHNILVINDDYVNVATQEQDGLDLTVRFTHHLPFDWNFRFNSETSWIFFQRTRLQNGQNSLFPALGSVGSPKFVGNMTFRFDHGPWTVNWFTDMVGHSSDIKFLGSDLSTNYQDLGIQARRTYSVPFYATHTVSVRRRFQDFTVEAGVRNVFDKKPPVYSTGGFDAVIGTFPLASQYDIVGRAFFLDIDKRF